MKKGFVNIKENNVFHSQVIFASEGGDINIGNYNIFEDKVIIHNISPTETLNIGDMNYFKECSKIVSCQIG